MECFQRTCSTFDCYLPLRGEEKFLHLFVRTNDLIRAGARNRLRTRGNAPKLCLNHTTQQVRSSVTWMARDW